MAFHTPGVYVQEIESGARPLEAVSTSNVGFVGIVPLRVGPEVRWADARGEGKVRRLLAPIGPEERIRGEKVDTLIADLGLQRTEVTDLGRFLALFGHRATFRTEGERTVVEIGKTKVSAPATDLDGKGQVLVADRTHVHSLLDDLAQRGLLLRPQPASVTEVVEAFGGSGVRLSASATTFALGPEKICNPTQFQSFLRRLHQQWWEAARGPAAPGPCDADVVDFFNIPEVRRFVLSVSGYFRNGGSIAYPYVVCAEGGDIPLHDPSAPRFGLGAFDDLEHDLQILCGPGLSPARQKEVLEYCERRGDCFAILDGPAERLSGEGIEKAGLLPASDRGFAAMYVPWFRVANPFQDKSKRYDAEIVVPPSGFMAGIYARVDGQRGVHKAPANEVVAGIAGLAWHINHHEQAAYNQRGINCVRDFGGRGVRVWGARTLSTLSNPSWRYINVRRLFIMVEKTIQLGSQWAVFEPNDSKLWARLRRNIWAFLHRVWASGALVGTTAEQAFYVKCDDETNPKEEVDAGYVNVEIGIAPVKPAEFVVFRIGQWDGGARVAE